jgi:hypothetical protein
MAAALLVAGGALIAFSSARSVRSGAQVADSAQDRSGRGLFAHDQKEHRKLDCAKCHSTSQSDQPKVKEFTHNKCITCHNFALEVFKQAAGRPGVFCAVCHDGRPMSKDQPALLARFPTPQKSDFGMTFSHEAHRKTLPRDLLIRPTEMQSGAFASRFKPGFVAGCIDCHQLTVPVGPVVRDIRTETGHAACFVCHGQQPEGARARTSEAFPYMGDCASCHLLGGPPSHDILGRVVRFKHQDHDLDTRPRRKGDLPASKSPDRLCAECHQSAVSAKGLDQITLPTQTYCSECHNGKVGLPDRLAKDVLDDLRTR